MLSKLVQIVQSYIKILFCLPGLPDNEPDPIVLQNSLNIFPVVNIIGVLLRLQPSEPPHFKQSVHIPFFFILWVLKCAIFIINWFLLVSECFLLIYSFPHLPFFLSPFSSLLALLQPTPNDLFRVLACGVVQFFQVFILFNFIIIFLFLFKFFLFRLCKL